MMADTPPSLDPSVRAALEKLADIVTPQPVSFVPQTWGWAVLAVFVLTLLAWALIRWQRHREANRYRREALAELAHIEQAMADTRRQAEALAAIPPLLKRVALAAWPRPQVAALSQGRWLAFIRGSEAEGAVPMPLAKLLKNAEYRSPAELTAMPAGDAQACVTAARHWIETHRVSA
jgi:Domain of unknown function (DUF4381)